MRKPVSSTQIILLALLIVTFAISAAAQNNKGAIVGTVKDPNDALVAKAQVKVTSTKTGEVRNTDTSDDGTYTVTNLEPGTYTVTVEAPGFQAVTFENVQVETNARLPLDTFCCVSMTRRCAASSAAKKAERSVSLLTRMTYPRNAARIVWNMLSATDIIFAAAW